MDRKDDYLNTSQKGIWKRFFKMLLKGKLPYVWIVIYIALSFGLTNVGISTTEYTAEMYAGNISFSRVIMPFIIFSLVSLLVGTVSGVAYYICTALIDRNLRRMVWKKAVRLPMGYYDKNEPTELLSRITTDTSQISVLIMQVFVSCITGLYSLVVLLGKVMSYDTGLMLSLMVCMPFMVGIPAILGKFNFGISHKVNEKNAQLTQSISEKVNNMESVKAFGAEEAELEAGKIKMRGLYDYTIKNSWLGQLTNPLYVIAGLIQALVILLVGRYYYMQGAITLTEWIAFFAFSESISANLSSYSGYWTSFKASQGSTNRVTLIMEAAEEDVDVGEKAQKLSGDICFEDVSFSYDGETTVLKGAAFRIPEKKRTVIVGPSGSGKSTIVNLLERFYEPDAGCVRIGDVDVSGYTLQSFREQFTCITQNSVPVSGSIRDNLLYGISAAISDEVLLDACKKADAYDFIMEFPDGLDTPVGENGSKLSGGQRQKLALARVFLQEQDYIILDEATSAVDVKSRCHFYDALSDEKQGKTIVVVAHNRQALRYADHVIVITDGAVEASGGPQEVAKKSAFFRELVREEEV